MERFAEDRVAEAAQLGQDAVLLAGAATAATDALTASRVLRNGRSIGTRPPDAV